MSSTDSSDTVAVPDAATLVASKVAQSTDLRGRVGAWLATHAWAVWRKETDPDAEADYLDQLARGNFGNLDPFMWALATDATVVNSFATAGAAGVDDAALGSVLNGAWPLVAPMPETGEQGDAT